jgi:hypothetical protein
MSKSDGSWLIPTKIKRQLKDNQPDEKLWKKSKYIRSPNLQINKIYLARIASRIPEYRLIKFLGAGFEPQIPLLKNPKLQNLTSGLFYFISDTEGKIYSLPGHRGILVWPFESGNIKRITFRNP